MKCFYGGQYVASREAVRSVLCPCGASFKAVPKFNRRVAGEVVPGYTTRIPAHEESKHKRK